MTYPDSNSYHIGVMYINYLVSWQGIYTTSELIIWSDVNTIYKGKLWCWIIKIDELITFISIVIMKYLLGYLKWYIINAIIISTKWIIKYTQVIVRLHNWISYGDLTIVYQMLYNVSQLTKLVCVETKKQPTYILKIKKKDLKH